MANPDRLAIRSSNMIEIAFYTGDTLGTFTRFVPRGAVTVSDQRGTQTYADWGSAIGEIATQTADGDRTVSLSLTAFLVPSDELFRNIMDAYEGNESVAVRVTAQERVGAEAFVRTYKGFFSQASFTLNQDGAAEISLNFVASQAIDPPVTP